MPPPLEYARSVGSRVLTAGERAGVVVLSASVGGIVGFVSMGLVVVAAGGGHGSYGPAVVLFPLAMALTHWTESIRSLNIVFAALQFPTYGTVIGAAVRTRLLWPVVLILFVIHVVSLTIAGGLVSRGFVP